jgi:hypothetical protein
VMLDGAFMATAERESYRRSDAGFSRLSNWRRRCMGRHFNSSWNASSFLLGSHGPECWSG